MKTDQPSILTFQNSDIAPHTQSSMQLCTSQSY